MADTENSGRLTAEQAKFVEEMTRPLTEYAERLWQATLDAIAEVGRGAAAMLGAGRAAASTQPPAGEAAEVRTEWAVQYPGDGYGPSIQPEGRARHYAHVARTAANEEFHATKLLCRTITVGPWQDADAPLATHSPDDGHPQCAGRVVRMDDVEYGYRQTTTNEPVPVSTRSFAEEEVADMAGWPDAAVMVRPVGPWRVADRDVRGELRWLIDQRAAVPGRPEEGPYPASLDEVADEVAAWVRKLAPPLPGLVMTRLATAAETQEAER